MTRRAMCAGLFVLVAIAIPSASPPSIWSADLNNDRALTKLEGKGVYSVAAAGGAMGQG